MNRPTDYEDGLAAGKAGLTVHKANAQFMQGWGHGRRIREARDGKILGVLCDGTRCKSCGQQNYGHRLGCACGGEIEWGFLTEPMQDGETAIFKSNDELLASTLPMVTIFEGTAISRQTGAPT